MHFWIWISLHFITTMNGRHFDLAWNRINVVSMQIQIKHQYSKSIISMLISSYQVHGWGWIRVRKFCLIVTWIPYLIFQNVTPCEISEWDQGQLKAYRNLLGDTEGYCLSKYRFFNYSVCVFWMIDLGSSKSLSWLKKTIFSKLFKWCLLSLSLSYLVVSTH